jgi:sensor histidine kinase regulating citrate/malate metabolism
VGGREFPADTKVVEVRIKDNGTESVEVVDNGSGIAQEDWDYIGGSGTSSRRDPSKPRLRSKRYGRFVYSKDYC